MRRVLNLPWIHPDLELAFSSPAKKHSFLAALAGLSPRLTRPASRSEPPEICPAYREFTARRYPSRLR